MDNGKEGFETTDEPYFQEIKSMKVNELGMPTKEILIDLEIKDLSIFWARKQRVLWLIILVCSLYFLSVLFDGGIFWVK